MINLPAREMRPADFPILALAIRREDERAFFRADQDSDFAHGLLLFVANGEIEPRVLGFWQHLLCVRMRYGDFETIRAGIAAAAGCRVDAARPLGRTSGRSGETARTSDSFAGSSGKTVRPSVESVRPSGKTVRPSGGADGTSGRIAEPSGKTAGLLGKTPR